MHLPEIRPIRDYTDGGRPLRPLAQHHEREDLHPSLVLVCGPRHPLRPPAGLAPRHTHLGQVQGINSQVRR